MVTWRYQSPDKHRMFPPFSIIMRKIYLIIVMCFISVLCYGQIEPEYEMEPYVFNTTDSSISVPLPCESAFFKAKAGASMYLTGIGKVKSYFYIKGVASSLVLDRNSEIIINTGGVSPQQSLSLIKLEILETKRRWKTGEIGSFTGASLNEDNSIAIKYKRYGDDSVIIATKNLQPGEYCLAISNRMSIIKSAKVYTFSIK